ncbi:MAG: hypothetical protein H6718_01865 [Polyangiaceae bacterium]|nr:hypothetical protein [Myxococcales bacterium]MCB9584110.1 hypothetical protein [Polyangiaceae bacterium]
MTGDRDFETLSELADERFLAALEHEVDESGDPLVALCAALPAYDLPQANVAKMRARLHAEFELSHAGAEQATRRERLGRAGRLIEFAVVASVCVIQIVWLFSMLSHH